MGKSSVSMLFFAILAFSMTCEDVTGARILVIMPTVVKSHFAMVEPYLKALAARGHELVVLSHFSLNEKIPNYTDINVKADMKTFGSKKGINIERVLANMNPITNVKNLNKFGVDNCRSVLAQPKIQELIKSQEKFDVAILIGISTSVLMPWGNERMGNPESPSYIPHLFSEYSDKMNFYERMMNSLTVNLYKVMYYFNVEVPTNKIVRKHFGDDMPDLSEIAKNTSLVLVNSHFSLNAPRPLVPGVVEVGGIHIIPPKPLPKHIQEYFGWS
ncbi:hypothetical protein L9F63_008354 [Diploptera punctata]|uniref:Uncharacterized protein n=1 Tax=Diploptera punctata TaxID=6984 RepID=A0AAD8E2F2_DIPPU|nr:hypothetical protein L9F63_008354 [Diploptera punctata]